MNTKMNQIKTLSALAVVCTALAVSADVLYWQVADAKNKDTNETVNFDYATVKVEGADDYLKLYDDNGPTEYWKLYTGDAAASSSDPAYSGTFTYDSGNNFLVELWLEGDSEDTRVGWERYAMSEYFGSIYNDDTPLSPSSRGGNTALVIGAVAPEPSSGLLALLGFAALALRRRRA